MWLLERKAICPSLFLRHCQLGRYLRSVSLVCLVTLGMVGCARKSAPEGGPYDLTPPRVVREVPANGSTGVKKGRIRIYFDEIVQVKGMAEKVIISPPQKNLPKMISMGKYVSVVLQDSLLPNTTYTIDFADAIVDNNEGNPMQGYVYAFSTGEAIDSMKISGRLLDARTLQPLSHILVGIYSNESPQAFATLPMERATRTNDQGEFLIDHIAQGSYRIVALDDTDKSFSYNLPSECFAYSDSVYTTGWAISPRPLTATSMDSPGKASLLEPDSLQAAPTSDKIHTPNDIVLFLSAKPQPPILFKKADRPDSTSFRLVFSAPIESLPSVKISAPKHLTKARLYPSIAEDRLSVTFHWKPLSGISQDTLYLEGTFPYSDSVGMVVYKKEILRLAPPRASSAPSSLGGGRASSFTSKTPLITFKSAEGWCKGSDRDSLLLLFSEPVEQFDLAKIHLSEIIDSIPHPIAFDLVPLEGVTDRWEIRWEKQFGREYECSIDSMAFTTIHGKINPPMKHALSIRPEKDFGKVSLSIQNVPSSAPFYVELLNEKEQVLATFRGSDSTLLFDHLLPSDYFVRLYVDSNNNGRWDNTHWNPYTAPEAVYYYPQALSVKAQFHTEEKWDPTATPLYKQRPGGLSSSASSQEAKNASSEKKGNLNDEYIQRMRDRYGETWNPSNRERKLLGMPSREEEKRTASGSHTH